MRRWILAGLLMAWAGVLSASTVTVNGQAIHLPAPPGWVSLREQNPALLGRMEALEPKGGELYDAYVSRSTYEGMIVKPEAKLPSYFKVHAAAKARGDVAKAEFLFLRRKVQHGIETKWSDLAQRTGFPLKGGHIEVLRQLLRQWPEGVTSIPMPLSEPAKTQFSFVEWRRVKAPTQPGAEQRYERYAVTRTYLQAKGTILLLSERAPAPLFDTRMPERVGSNVFYFWAQQVAQANQ